MDLAPCHREVKRPAFTVDDGVNFRGATATIYVDRLMLLPPLCRWLRSGLHDSAVDQIKTVTRLRCQRVENPLPDAVSSPTN